jgi:hypothetical protein
VQVDALLRDMCYKLDGLTAAASTVAAAIQADQLPHALPAPPPAPIPDDASGGSAPAATSSAGGTVIGGAGAGVAGGTQQPAAQQLQGPALRSQQRAEARHRAFSQAALQRCRARLLAGEGRGEGAGAGVGGGREGRAGVAAAARRQVEKLVQAATSVDNLSRMFEGWTPWL